MYVFVSVAFWLKRARRSILRRLRWWPSSQRWWRRQRGPGAACRSWSCVLHRAKWGPGPLKLPLERLLSNLRITSRSTARTMAKNQPSGSLAANLATRRHIWGVKGHGLFRWCSASLGRRSSSPVIYHPPVTLHPAARLCTMAALIVIKQLKTLDPYFF